MEVQIENSGIGAERRSYLIVSMCAHIHLIEQASRETYQN